MSRSKYVRENRQQTKACSRVALNVMETKDADNMQSCRIYSTATLCKLLDTPHTNQKVPKISVQSHVSEKIKLRISILQSVTMTMRMFQIKKPARRDAFPAAENAECFVFGDLFSSILIFLHVFKYLCSSHSCSPVNDWILSADLSFGSSRISTSFSVRSDVTVTVKSLTEQSARVMCSWCDNRLIWTLHYFDFQTWHLRAKLNQLHTVDCFSRKLFLKLKSFSMTVSR